MKKSERPSLRVLRDALREAGIEIPLAVLRVASDEEKSALADIVVSRRARLTTPTLR